MYHPIELSGMMNIFKNEENFHHVKGFWVLTDLLNYIQAQPLDGLILDLFDLEAEGQLIIQQIYEKTPDVKVIILGGDKSGHLIQNMMQMGAHAYLIKGESTAFKLKEAVRKVFTGETFLDAKIEKRLWNPFAEDAPRRDFDFQVSKREKEILVLIKRGLTNKEIADQLCIALNTVNTHRKNLMLKLDVKNIIGLCKKVTELGLEDGE